MFAMEDIARNDPSVQWQGKYSAILVLNKDLQTISASQERAVATVCVRELQKPAPKCQIGNKWQIR
jgi:hypothetical protein